MLEYLREKFFKLTLRINIFHFFCCHVYLVNLSFHFLVRHYFLDGLAKQITHLANGITHLVNMRTVVKKVAIARVTSRAHVTISVVESRPFSHCLGSNFCKKLSNPRSLHPGQSPMPICQRGV